MNARNPYCKAQQLTITVSIYQLTTSVYHWNYMPLSYIPTCNPSKREYEHPGYIVKLTSELPAWDPYFSSYASQERSMMTRSGDIHEQRPTDRAIFSIIAKLNTEEDIKLVAPSESDKVLYGLSPTLSPTAFIIAAINLSNTHSILSSID